MDLIRLTPPGRGAVATLLLQGKLRRELQGKLQGGLQGESAIALLERFLDRPIEYAPGRTFFARFPLGSDGHAEELVLYPRSPDSVRIHTHGGEAVVAAITEILCSAGVRTLDWREYLRHVSAGPDWKDPDLKDPDSKGPGLKPKNGVIDNVIDNVIENTIENTIEAEARIALAACRTERTAKILLDQLGGALQTALEERRFEELYRWSALGLRLTEPFRVVLAGATNAGKSSLFNALLGFSRGIVDPTPGTTRDVVSAETALDGWPVRLVDTAGYRPAGETSDDPLELLGMEQARRALAEADLIVEVVDAATGIRIDGFPAGRLLVYNKTDLLSPEIRADDGAVSFDAVSTGAVPVSAVTGEGIEVLAERIIRALVPENPPPGTAIPFTPELIARLAALRRTC
ncbi:MAG TPA: hypothetical protein DEB39_10050 [Planctomycetaceae bacterium]|nr:hypothetical protein [Planctomycetaceae bacterium]